jgi:hypothetical protein
MEGLRINMEIINQDNRCAGRYPNRESPWRSQKYTGWANLVLCNERIISTSLEYHDKMRDIYCKKKSQNDIVTSLTIWSTLHLHVYIFQPIFFSHCITRFMYHILNQSIFLKQGVNVCLNENSNWCVKLTSHSMGTCEVIMYRGFELIYWYAHFIAAHKTALTSWEVCWPLLTAADRCWPLLTEHQNHNVLKCGAYSEGRQRYKMTYTVKKGKVVPVARCHKDMGGVEVKLHHYWPRNWMEVGGQLHTLAALPRAKNSGYTLEKRMCGSQSRSGSWEEEEKLAPAGNQTPTIPSIVCRYTDGANLKNYVYVCHR